MDPSSFSGAPRDDEPDGAAPPPEPRRRAASSRLLLRPSTAPPPAARSHYEVAHAMGRIRSSLIGGGVGAAALAAEPSARDLASWLVDDDHDDTGDSGSDSETEAERLEIAAQVAASWPGRPPLPQGREPSSLSSARPRRSTGGGAPPKRGRLGRILGQAPAVLLVGALHLMIGIPFGVSYFPVDWGDGDGAPFPLPHKEALGIRMFLFATLMAQLAFLRFSGFDAPVGLQMIENVPFCHGLAEVAIRHYGPTARALGALLGLLGIGSALVGLVFGGLGRLRLGRVAYYFPAHVLLGCIGGIGIFIVRTGLEVTLNHAFTIPCLWTEFRLLWIVVALELLLRLLEHLTKDRNGVPRFELLTPVYFCSVPFVFYLGLFLLGIPMEQAMAAGYFFPPLDACSGGDDCAAGPAPSLWGSIFNRHLLDIWTVVDFRAALSLSLLREAAPVLLALVLFSLIHVPINIPAFAVSCGADVDMDRELVAHGVANLASGLCGGLQNYMAYTHSVLFYRSGGRGTGAGLAVAGVVALLFLVGPAVAAYVPRCMAGAMLLHLGIDLFLEAVCDSYGRFDRLEYGGIWFITVVMAATGMEAAMVSSFVVAITTYCAQNMTYVSPIRGWMTAEDWPSSLATRSSQELAVLDDPTNGRHRILLVQLQGNLFFGNAVNLTNGIHELLSEIMTNPDGPVVVVMDFTLVLGIDSSAAQAIGKLKTAMQKKYRIEHCIFVSGSITGFPTDYNLSSELSTSAARRASQFHFDCEAPTNEATRLLAPTRGSPLYRTSNQIKIGVPTSSVCASLDEALVLAENTLIARKDPSLLQEHAKFVGPRSKEALTLTEERDTAQRYLTNLCPAGTDPRRIAALLERFQREVYRCGDLVWERGAPGDCLKLVVRGDLLALHAEDVTGTLSSSSSSPPLTGETIHRGNTIGELGLIEGSPRMNAVQVVCDEAVLYSLNREAYEGLERADPAAARLVERICIRYLSLRVQHVSNRTLETRYMPI